MTYRNVIRLFEIRDFCTRRKMYTELDLLPVNEIVHSIHALFADFYRYQQIELLMTGFKILFFQYRKGSFVYICNSIVDWLVNGLYYKWLFFTRQCFSDIIG